MNKTGSTQYHQPLPRQLILQNLQNVGPFPFVHICFAGMLSPRGQCGLEAKFCGLGLIGFGLSLVKYWPRSHVS